MSTSTFSISSIPLKKSSNISFQSREGTQELAYTTSWGSSTRLIGGMIMMHGDDDGMIMPPRVAPQQVIIIPIIKKDTDEAVLLKYCQDLKDKLLAQDIRVKLDDSDNKSGDKMWSSIKKGYPIRVEIGGREMDEGQVTHTRRDIGRDSKATTSMDDFCASVAGLLDDIHDNMFERARKNMLSMIHDVADLDAVRTFLKVIKKVWSEWIVPY